MQPLSGCAQLRSVIAFNNILSFMCSRPAARNKIFSETSPIGDSNFGRYHRRLSKLHGKTIYHPGKLWFTEGDPLAKLPQSKRKILLPTTPQRTPPCKEEVEELHSCFFSPLESKDTGW